MVYTDLCSFYFSVFDEHAVDMTLKEFVELLRGERWKAQVEEYQPVYPYTCVSKPSFPHRCILHRTGDISPLLSPVPERTAICHYFSYKS